MKKILYILFVVISSGLFACSSGFNADEVSDILHKSEISEKEYSRLLEYYEICMDDAIKLAENDKDSLSKKEQEKLFMLFSIGKRLALDEERLTSEQNKEYDRITKKGTEGLK